MARKKYKHENSPQNLHAETFQLKASKSDDGHHLPPPSFEPTASKELDKRLDKNFGGYKGYAKEFMHNSGADISNVKVAKDNSKLQELGASGAAKGNEIILGDNQPNKTEEDKDTFMHEMVHVVQQRATSLSANKNQDASKVNNEDKLENEAKNWQNYKAPSTAKASTQKSSSNGVYQLKKKKKESNSYSKTVFNKVASAYQILLDKRAIYRRKNYEAEKQVFTDGFTNMLDKFVEKSGELISKREYYEKFYDDSEKSTTEEAKKVQGGLGKFSHGLSLLSSLLTSNGDKIDDSIEDFSRFLNFVKDFIPDVPIIKHYLTFLFDGGIKILDAIKQIKAKIADLNAVGRHAGGSDYKAMSNADGSQALFDYINQYTYKKSSSKDAPPIPTKVKEYIYDNQERLQFDIKKRKNELPPDDSSNPFKWTTYNEEDLREWVFNNRDAIYEKFTGYRK